MAPLLVALGLGASAAAPSPGVLSRDARALADRAEYQRARVHVDEALARYGSRDDDDVWALRLLDAEILLASKPGDARTRLETLTLPPRLHASETAVRRAALLALATRSDAGLASRYIAEASRIAASTHPRMLPYVYLISDSVRPDEEKVRLAWRLAARNGDELSELRAINSIVLRLVAAGRADEAIGWGERALPRMRARHLHGLVEKLEGNLGWAYQELGDLEAAAELYAAAERHAAEIGHPDRAIWLNSIGMIHFERREYDLARTYFHRARQSAEEVNKPSTVAHALTNLATIALLTGRVDEARAHNAAALTVKAKLQDAESILRSRILAARIDAAAGASASAEQTLAEVRSAAKTNAVRWEAEARLGEIFAATGRHDEVDAQYRAAIDGAVDARSDINDRELRLAFFNTVDEIFDTYVDYLVRRGRSEDALAVTEISRAQAMTGSAASVGRAIDPREIARRTRSTILCYWLGRARSFAWVVDAAEVRVVPLPADHVVNRAVDAYAHDLLGTKSSIAQSGAAGAELFRMLVGPAGAIAPESRVIVVPDGRLHSLNMETLVVSSPAPHYWIEDAVLMTAGSLAALRAEPTAPLGDPAMLLIGNPSTADPAFPALERAAEEIELVRRSFGRSRVLAGDEATPDAYRRATPESFDYVHFVAHAIASRRKPLDSAVILSGDRMDYQLTARAILEQKLRARLVTISSCYGAGTREYVGEGLVGLAWAFLGAGAEQVIAAVWEVDDAAAPELMSAMYAGIRAGKQAPEALREAKLRLVRSQTIHRTPRYWAPFVLYTR